jgi:isoaspartyl peptidase/L-asparaginase-like protein (Ntn-hydrolase superfamily)
MKKLNEAEVIDKLKAEKATTNNLQINAPSKSVALETVGAIVFDSQGNFCSAVSSGGILLKHPGRIGHASMYGCGCWVDEHINEVDDSKHSIAICTTGCGEQIIKILFAKEFSDYMIFNNETDVSYLNQFFQNYVFSKSNK